MIMEAEKSHSCLLQVGENRKVGGIVSSESKGMKTQVGPAGS